MAEAESFSLGTAGLLNTIPAQRARLLLAQGDLAQAARWTSECGLGPDDKPDYAREQGQLVLARLLLAQDRADKALALLDRLDGAGATQGRTGSLVEIRALRAMALATVGDDTAARAVLAAALRYGRAEGYVRVFADEGPGLSGVLGELIAAQRTDEESAAIPLAYVARLQRAFGAARSPDDGAILRALVPHLAEQLTGRELEILALLATGESNKRIARRLFISLDTVKKHVSDVLGKLGASNRTEAVARGRELGLIDR